MELVENVFDGMDMLLPYLFSQPGEGSSGRNERGWPLIFFLHGAGERGRRLETIRPYGVPLHAAKARNFPFFTISPLCPSYSYWEDIDAVLFALLDDILSRYPVDPRRVYLTGMSMGGHGTWVMALQQPGRFAALAPVCPPFPYVPGLAGRVDALRGTPVWIFHGAKDDVVPVENAQRMVEVLRAAGAAVQITIYPHARHDAWTHAYADRKLYAWFLRHERE